MYIVIELQASDGKVASIVTNYTDHEEAQSKFHQIMAAAAVSSVSCHSAVILDETGMSLRQESYTH